MEPKQYAPVILKVLKDVGFKDPAGLTKVLIGKMEVLDDLMGDGAVSLGESSMLEVSPKVETFRARRQEEPPIDLSKGILIGEAPTEEVDIFSAVAKPKVTRNLSDEEATELKSACIQKFKASLPPQILCNPPGFAQPLVLTCKQYFSAPGPIPIFKILYAPQGMPEGFEVSHVINIGERIPSASEVIQSLTSQAEALYRSKPTSAPPPQQTTALPLGMVGAAFNPTDADSPNRPVEKPGDGLTVDEMKYFRK